MAQSVLGGNARDAARGVQLPGRYEVTGMIGVGGMASIWAAEDGVLRRAVAIKVLAEQFAEQPRFVERFAREARTAASLSGHPHVVTIYDVGEHAGRPFIVMEHLAGGTFADRMSAGRPARADVLRWLGEVAAALDFAHSSGVVHRDVKPRNLLFDGHDRLVVADFGIARAAFEEQLTTTGELLGTAAYMSPEQTVGEPATPASDRYALAVVAYEALTGGLPFGSGTLIELAARRTQMDAPRASERAPGLPAAVDDVLLRGLARDPAQRWETAGEFAGALAAAAGPDPVSGAKRLPRGPEPPTTVTSDALGRPSLTMERARRRPSVPAILLGLAAVAVGLIAGLTLLGADDGNPDRAPIAKQERGGRSHAGVRAAGAGPIARRSAGAGTRFGRRLRCRAQRPRLRADERGPLRRGDPGPAGRGGRVPAAEHRPHLRLRPLQPRSLAAPGRPRGRGDPRARAAAGVQEPARRREARAERGAARRVGRGLGALPATRPANPVPRPRSRQLWRRGTAMRS